jgi:hypothetical protein
LVRQSAHCHFSLRSQGFLEEVSLGSTKEQAGTRRAFPYRLHVPGCCSLGWQRTLAARQASHAFTVVAGLKLELLACPGSGAGFSCAISRAITYQRPKSMDYHEARGPSEDMCRPTSTPRLRRPRVITRELFAQRTYTRYVGGPESHRLCLPRREVVVSTKHVVCKVSGR